MILADCFIFLNFSFHFALWGDGNNGTYFVGLLEGLMDLTQSQAHCLVIPNIEECFFR